MNGDVQYDLQGGNVSFDVLYRLDQLADALTDLYGTPGWRVSIEVDPGIVLTATPARDLVPAETPWKAPLALVQGQNAPAQDHTAPDASQGRSGA